MVDMNPRSITRQEVEDAAKDKSFIAIFDLSEVDLRGASLSGANLATANLFGCNLSDADLSSACLYKANLHRASLIRANLSGTDLSESDLSEADLFDVKWDENTVWPCGFCPCDIGLSFNMTALKNNDGRDTCAWCNSQTKKIDSGFSWYNVCTKCGR